jgi:choline dehydrogenase-like flavoprotein
VHCIIARLPNPWSVVDSHGAVKGIDGLRVIDASIMPVVPSVALLGAITQIWR